MSTMGTWTDRQTPGVSTYRLDPWRGRVRNRVEGNYCWLLVKEATSQWSNGGGLERWVSSTWAHGGQGGSAAGGGKLSIIHNPTNLADWHKKTIFHQYWAFWFQKMAFSRFNRESQRRLDLQLQRQVEICLWTGARQFSDGAFQTHLSGGCHQLSLCGSFHGHHYLDPFL